MTLPTTSVMQPQPEDDPFAALSAEIDSKAPKLQNPMEFGSGGVTKQPVEDVTESTEGTKESAEAEPEETKREERESEEASGEPHDCDEKE